MIIINKVILMGRLTRDPEMRYSQGANPIAVARYSLAVRRMFSRQGEPDVDFINVVAFAKAAEFTEKYFRKGQNVAIAGRLQVRNWEDTLGNKKTTTEVIIEEQHFTGSKASHEDAGAYEPKEPSEPNTGGFIPINQALTEDEDLPF